MPTLVYRRRGSTGAASLADALGGERFRGLKIPIEKKAKDGDIIICWGETFIPANARVRVLNGAPIQSKFSDAVTLNKKGIPSIEVAQGNPHQEGWIPRNLFHSGGTDLLRPGTERIGYWVKKEELGLEVRIHSFLGKSIRAGVKVPREGVQPHPWIRTWEGGWRLSYDGRTARERHRSLAHQALTALGLDFGAVDIGEKADGTCVVLEVNRAPGLEGRTIDAYATAISGWIEGGK